MCDLTIHAGSMGDSTQIYVQWLDENGIRQTIELEIAILNQDKPRTLELRHKPPGCGDVLLLCRERGDRNG